MTGHYGLQSAQISQISGVLRSLPYGSTEYPALGSLLKSIDSNPPLNNTRSLPGQAYNVFPVATEDEDGLSIRMSGQKTAEIFSATQADEDGRWPTWRFGNVRPLELLKSPKTEVVKERKCPVGAAGQGLAERLLYATDAGDEVAEQTDGGRGGHSRSIVGPKSRSTHA
ncbi:hypothetical protein B0H14DRAFT_2595736 [Mycena olivaceomarginata]|nr:hypothetical protein B0H14DRAFT_2595736 [Mycena olivaceomarginata]